MRTAVTIIALIIYVGMFNFYVYSLPNPYLTIIQCKVLFFVSTLFISIFRETDRAMGFVSFYHFQFNTLCFLSLIINLIFCLLVLVDVFDKEHWQKNSYILNGSIFVTSILLFKAMAQHGYFKQKYEND